MVVNSLNTKYDIIRNSKVKSIFVGELALLVALQGESNWKGGGGGGDDHLKDATGCQ